MPQKEYEIKIRKPIVKAPPISTRTQTMEQLYTMKTDDLVKLLLTSEMTQPANAPLRQQIIRILQQREGNAFVQRVLGKGAGKI